MYSRYSPCTAWLGICSNYDNPKWHPDWTQAPLGTTHYLHISDRPDWYQQVEDCWYVWYSDKLGWAKVRGKLHIQQLNHHAVREGESPC